MMHQQVMDNYNGQMNPYGMAAAMNQQQVIGPGMQQRRFS